MTLEMWRCPVGDCRVQYLSTHRYSQDGHLASEHLDYFRERVEQATEKLVYGSHQRTYGEAVREAVREPAREFKQLISSVTTFPPENVPERPVDGLLEPFRAPLLARLMEIASIGFGE